MITQIAIKEIKELVREGRFRVMSVVLIALLILSTVISHQYYAWVNEQHESAKTNARNVWVSQDEKNPHSAAHYGTYAFKPKYPMSLVDQGIDKYTGTSIYLEGHRRNEAQYMAAQDQTAISRFGDLTPDFILLFIIPLFIILIGFNLFSGERERGTLRLLLSQGISPFKIAMGKWLALFLLVTAIVIPIFVLALVLLGGLDNFGEFSFGALCLLFAVYLTLYIVFINLTLIISASTKRSNIALVLLLAIWMITCLGTPKAANRLAETFYPYPTQNEFLAGIHEDEEKGIDGHDPFDAAAKKFEQETLKEYGVDSVQQLPFNWDGYLMQKGEEHAAEIYFKHYEALRQTYFDQAKVYRVSALLSPYLPARFLSMALCRTDYNAHWNFNDAAEKYRLSLMNSLNMDFAKNSRYGDWDYKADKSLWAGIPDFSYSPPSYAEILELNRANIIVLVAWAMVSGVLMVALAGNLKGI